MAKGLFCSAWYLAVLAIFSLQQLENDLWCATGAFIGCHFSLRLNKQKRSTPDYSERDWLTVPFEIPRNIQKQAGGWDSNQSATSNYKPQIIFFTQKVVQAGRWWWCIQPAQYEVVKKFPVRLAQTAQNALQQCSKSNHRCIKKLLHFQSIFCVFANNSMVLVYLHCS